MPLIDVGKLFTFRGAYLIAMIAEFFFLFMMIFDNPEIWPIVLVLLLTMVLYDMDVVFRLKKSNSPFRATGYLVLLGLVVSGLGFVDLYFFAVGVIIVGPVFYFYDRSRIMRAEYGRRIN